jgi:hypothetical protein
MPRQNDGTELLKRIDTLQVFRQQLTNGGATTLAAPATAGATAINLTANTSFTANDPIFIVGANGFELNQITATTPTTAVPLLYKAAFAAPTGTPVLEAVATNLAHITEDGLSWSASAQLTDIFSALRAGAIARMFGQGTQEISFSLLGFNNLNFQTWLGIPEAEIGAGTVADPHQVSLGSAAMGLQGFQCIRVTGTRLDGKTMLIDFNDATIAPSGAVTLNRNAPASLPCTLRFSDAVARIWS